METMFILMMILFIVGYACIALEHPIHINKSASALLLGCLMWVLLIFCDPSTTPVFSEFQNYLKSHPEGTFAGWLAHGPLLEHLGEIAEILFFLLGAMTIVELIDTHEGFGLITDKIRTTKKSHLLWIISFITFFMSSVLDNLTSSIVMVALLRKLIANKKDRWFFAGFVILAANAGGAWSPIGDVTTIMLWIGGKISALNIILFTFLASLVSMIVPLLIVTLYMKGHVQTPHQETNREQSVHPIASWERNSIFFVGVGILLFVPIFKTVTHLPPYLGMLGGLGVLWILTEIIHKKRPEDSKRHLMVASILSKIDTSSILFFLGILLAVSALQTGGHLESLARSMDSIPLHEPQKYYLVSVIIGILSSIVDNVPLVAGAMGMYHFPIDHYFWEFLAYTAGTGGSILIIGSAAGVVVMGMEKIDFIWYLKRISLLALAGYFAGCAVYILQRMIL